MSQSTWSVSEYQVKPTIGTPSLRTRSTLAHCFHSQSTASCAVRALVEVGLGVHHRQAVAVVVLPGDLVIAEDLAGGAHGMPSAETRCSLVM